MGLLVIFLTIYWLLLVADSDGNCHMETCDGCPYESVCPDRR